MINENLEEEISLNCPFCIEINTIMVDMTAGRDQEFVYDCSVCCHPIVILNASS